jgi:hypothetical protein
MNRSLTIAAVLVLLAPAAGYAQATTGFYTATTNSNVRAAPTTNSHRIGLLPQGTRVRVVGSAAGGNWHRVRLGSGQLGFVYGPLLTPDASTAGAPDKRDLVGGPTPAPEGAFAYIVWPTDGEKIPGGDFVVLFGLHGMGTAPAGVDKEHTGHHHLLIDTNLPPLDKPIPADDNHIHFGRGQTEHQIKLPPGEHTLQLLLGDANHIPHSPPVMSEQIKVYVE